MLIPRICTLNVVLACALLWSCQSASQSRRYDRQQAQASLSKLEAPGLVIGEFRLPYNAILDGDTITVTGLDTTLRLLAIDTEETFKNEEDLRESQTDFAAYLRNKRGDKSKPVKAATPLGEDAKVFAKHFFQGATSVRLERDHPKEIRGRFNRYLTYVFVKKADQWVNYNVEAVRAGMSPYFSKYGYSRRFHDEFVAAEKEAQAKQLGIWKPGCACYTDYAERKVWWDERADFIADFEKRAKTHDDHVILTNWDALRTIESRMGQKVTVLATVSDIRYGDKGPSKAVLSRRQFADLPAIFFDKDVFSSSQIAQYKGEYVAVTGTVNQYRDKRRNTLILQLVVDLPSQVRGPQSTTTTTRNTP